MCATLAWASAPGSANLFALVAIVITLGIICVLARRFHRYTRRMGPLNFHFDGRRWYTSSGTPVQLIDGYACGWLLAARVVVDGAVEPLLLCRCQVSRERWRRLRLACLAQSAPVGVSIVSPASESRSG